MTELEKLRTLRREVLSRVPVEALFQGSEEKFQRMLDFARSGDEEKAGRILTHAENKYFSAWVQSQMVA